LTVIPLEIGKHGFKTLAECGGICGVDDSSSFFLNPIELEIMIFGCVKYLACAFVE
jgi:hypothetical protein